MKLTYIIGILLLITSITLVSSLTVDIPFTNSTIVQNVTVNLSQDSILWNGHAYPSDFYSPSNLPPAGNPFDQSLNTTDDVAFSSILINSTIKLEYLDNDPVFGKLARIGSNYGNIWLALVGGGGYSNPQIMLADSNILPYDDDTINIGGNETTSLIGLAKRYKNLFLSGTAYANNFTDGICSISGGNLYNCGGIINNSYALISNLVSLVGNWTLDKPNYWNSTQINNGTLMKSADFNVTNTSYALVTQLDNYWKNNNATENRNYTTTGNITANVFKSGNGAVYSNGTYLFIDPRYSGGTQDVKIPLNLFVGNIIDFGGDLVMRGANSKIKGDGSFYTYYQMSVASYDHVFYTRTNVGASLERLRIVGGAVWEAINISNANLNIRGGLSVTNQSNFTNILSTGNTTLNNLNVTGNFSAKRPYWSGYDNSTQAFLNTANTQVVNISNNADIDAYQISIIGNQNITFQRTGDYLILFQPEFYQATGSNKEIQFWFQKNGVDIPFSNSAETMANGQYLAVPITIQIDIENPATDNIRIMWWSDSTASQIITRTGLTTPTRPSIPGVILNVQKVSELTE